MKKWVKPNIWELSFKETECDENDPMLFVDSYHFCHKIGDYHKTNGNECTGKDHDHANGCKIKDDAHPIGDWNIAHFSKCCCES